MKIKIIYLPSGNKKVARTLNRLYEIGDEISIYELLTISNSLKLNVCIDYDTKSVVAKDSLLSGSQMMLKANIV